MEDEKRNSDTCPANSVDIRETIKTALKDAFNSHFSPRERDYFLPSKNALYLKKNARICKVPIDRITHIEVEGRYSILQYENEKFMISQSLKSMLITLKHKHFIQSHRNIIVNQNRIKEIFPNDNLIIFDNGKRTTMSGRFKMALIKELDVLH